MSYAHSMKRITRRIIWLPPSANPPGAGSTGMTDRPVMHSCLGTAFCPSHPSHLDQRWTSDRRRGTLRCSESASLLFFTPPSSNLPFLTRRPWTHHSVWTLFLFPAMLCLRPHTLNAARCAKHARAVMRLHAHAPPCGRPRRARVHSEHSPEPRAAIRTNRVERALERVQVVRAVLVLPGRGRNSALDEYLRGCRC
jgi:hypothetical protein